MQINYSGEILFVNKASEMLLEESNSVLLGGSIQFILPDSNIIRAIKDQRTEISHYTLSKPLLLIETPDNNKKTGTILIFEKNDHSNLFNMFNVKQSLKQDLQSIMNLSGELMTIVDKSGNVLNVSSSCEQLMGIKAQRFIKKTVYDLQNEGIVSFSSTIQVIQTKKKVTIAQTTQLGKRLLVRGYPIFNENGKLSKIINISSDVTKEENLRTNLEDTKELLDYYRSELNSIQKKEQRMIIRSKPMQEIYELICKIADVQATISIFGETGVGKGVLAKTIHDLSSRRDHPFIKVNCGTIPETLIESELFGYSKGAFTGANKGGKKGLITAANHGTLFLDEIGELPMHLQAKLLQVLQEGQFTPLGETTPKKVNVRYIVATNRDLEYMVRNEEFRKDLYYRLNIIPITIPPLRKRKEDIPILTEFFLNLFNQRYNQSKTIDNQVVQWFVDYEWEGNIRELQNTVERLVVTTSKDHIQLGHLPYEISSNKNHDVSPSNHLSLKERLSQYEKEIIEKTLQHSSTLKEVSKKLGIDTSTVSRKMKKHGIAVMQ